jgi:hypothetical protein
VNAIEPPTALAVAKGLMPMFGVVCALQIARLALSPYSTLKYDPWIDVRKFGSHWWS